jgi:guanosine-3',5'-bis(diphosphate) 3'-pyrophosphohydrolase
MGKLRSELEDLSFQNLYPEEYKKLARSRSAPPELEAALEKINRNHQNEIGGKRCSVRRSSRSRQTSLFALEKIKKQKITIDQVYDLIAARIITPNDKKIVMSL